MSKSASESEWQCRPFTRKYSDGEWVRENKDPLHPPQKIIATEKLLYVSVCSHSFNLLTCSNYSYSTLIYVWQLYIKKKFSLTEQCSCLQAGRGEYHMFRWNVNQSFGQFFHENISATGYAQWFFLICSGPSVFCLPLKSRKVDLIRDFFQFVSQGFFWY